MNYKKNFELPDLYKCTVSVIGLGYVGLPLAIEFAKCKTSLKDNKPLERNVIGFDINNDRINQLKKGIDITNETNLLIENQFTNLEFTNDHKKLVLADVFIVTVPTPVDSSNKPNFSYLKKACEIIGVALKKNNSQYSPIIIFESTVYPGATEEICVPLIKENSGLSVYLNSTSRKSFGFGYSPERINPGDNIHKLDSIVKVTSGNNKKVSHWIDSFYGSIISAGTYCTSNIKVAEAAKVIENTQRDINIALVNELSIICRKLNIDTIEVINAAKTKWNFIPFYPGLVGGHCIGVDPYYLTYKSEEVGYSPKVILAGRKINDQMASWYVEQLILEMVKRNIEITSSNALVLGFTFKENCPDIRNTKSLDVVKTLSEFIPNIDIVDPYADRELASNYYGLNILNQISSNKRYSLIIITVAHDFFLEFDADYWRSLCQKKYIIFDLKGIVPKDLNPIRP